MLLTQEQFYKLYPAALKYGTINNGLYEQLTKAMDKYQINNKLRESYFLGQLAHECVGFKYIYELGTKAYFKRYDGRKDLGNTQVGDGYRYRGRGFIQLTGRYNYRKYGKKLGIDLENNPDLALGLDIACLIAAQYWDDIKGNELSDLGEFKTITKRINGGYNGLTDRINRANKVASLI